MKSLGTDGNKPVAAVRGVMPVAAIVPVFPAGTSHTVATEDDSCICVISDL